jgi:hypothetical protein
LIASSPTMNAAQRQSNRKRGLFGAGGVGGAGVLVEETLPNRGHLGKRLGTRVVRLGLASISKEKAKPAGASALRALNHAEEGI